MDPEIEEDLVEPWDLQVYNHGRVPAADEVEKDGEIVIWDSSIMYRAEVEGLEEGLDDIDMSEESIYHSGPFEKKL